ncbi:hypothetical protein [Pseudomonas auratipiscis]|uniref:DUF2937 family protein n=1 Tax=Pseudomonas auratipiscis TaxID=3115853 RepID=A0AB35WTY7_9PSED|nr:MULTISPECIES: hypothetical protein [unclassified Pseudomonas]MEE1866894.1 hypothetical protein [Pseudomonas sp. 120P]MEE1960592.1 hypothetical protein [Pseudomonas sp. 119P]
MVTIPTDSLPKCLAILGLVMIFGSYYYWWPLKVEADTDYVEMRYQTDKYRESYREMAESTNKAIKLINSVGGDRSKLDDVQMDFIKKQLDIATPASKKTEQTMKEMEKPLKLAAARYERFVLASWVFGAVFVLGLLCSCGGFYMWGKSAFTKP